MNARTLIVWQEQILVRVWIHEKNVIGGIGPNITQVQEVPANQGRQPVDEGVKWFGPYITDKYPIRPYNPIVGFSKH